MAGDDHLHVLVATMGAFHVQLLRLYDHRFPFDPWSLVQLHLHLVLHGSSQAVHEGVARWWRIVSELRLPGEVFTSGFNDREPARPLLDLSFRQRLRGANLPDLVFACNLGSRNHQCRVLPVGTNGLHRRLHSRWHQLLLRLSQLPSRIGKYNAGNNSNVRSRLIRFLGGANRSRRYGKARRRGIAKAAQYVTERSGLIMVAGMLPIVRCESKTLFCHIVPPHEQRILFRNKSLAHDSFNRPAYRFEPSYGGWR